MNLSSKNILIARFPWVLRKIAVVALREVPAVRTLLAKRGSLTHGDDDDLKRAVESIEFFRRAVEQEGATFHGSTVLELGTGDNLLVPVGLAALGAKKVVTIDPMRYLLPQEAWLESAARLLARLECDDPVAELLARVTYLNVPSEELPANWSDSFDVVLSYSVIEHVADVAGVCRSISRILRCGGLTCHEINFSSHGHMKREGGPLEFLMYPSAVWNLLKAGGGINRVRLSGVLAALEDASLQPRTVEKLEELDADYVRGARPRLSRRFRECSVDDLRVLRCHLTAAKV